MPANLETLLDLARQRLNTIAASPNFTRDARHLALAMERTVAEELAALNDGRPQRVLVPVGNRATATAKEIEPEV